jgi:hypothetical protein
MGFWESEPLTSIHEEILLSAGSSWHDVSQFPPAWFHSETAAAFRLRLIKAVQADFGEPDRNPLIVIKDPRVCRLIPLWREVLADLNASVQCVIPVRNPLEVAASLKRRDGFPESKSVLLWLRHFLTAERETRDLPRSFVSYDDLLTDWQAVADRIGRDLKLAWPSLSHQIEAQICNYLSTYWRHHKLDHAELFTRGEIPEWVKICFEWVMDATQGHIRAFDELDRVFEEFNVAAHAFMPMLWAETSRRERDVQEPSTQPEEVNAAQAEAAIREARAEREAAERAAHEAVASAQAQADAAIHRAIAERELMVDACAAKDAIVNNLTLEIERIAHESAAESANSTALSERLEDTEARLRCIEMSTFWQASLPVRQTLSLLPPSFRAVARRTARRMLSWQLVPKMREGLRARKQTDLGLACDFDALPTSASCKELAEPATVDVASVLSAAPRGRIAVVVHVHYPEIWPEISDALGCIPEEFDLFVSVTKALDEGATQRILAAFPHAYVAVFPDHGRDILPFLTFAATGVLNRYTLVCKLLTKRTPYRQDGTSWRTTPVDGVLGSQDKVERILKAFQSDQDLGIVVADGQVYGARPEHWIGNYNRVIELSVRLGWETLPNDILFPGGSIFWIRPVLLRPLVALKLSPGDFEPEPRRIDGTTAHAVERMVGVVCSESGMRIAESGALAASPLSPRNCPAPQMIAY